MWFRQWTVARVVIAMLFTAAAGSVPAAARPNVVLIMTDDQGIGDFGVMGNDVIKTPHIDTLAASCASMSTFYVSPVCSPTRASLMTGRYNYRTRCIDTWLGRSMLEPDEVTIAEVLRQAGYATGVFGKWHLGDCYPMRPTDQGFEESLVHRGGGLAQPSEPRENRRRYTNPILFHNGRQVRTKGYCTDVYFDAAVDFIEAAHRDEREFFVYLATNAPHDPYHDVPEHLRRRYARNGEQLARLYVRPPRDLDAAVDTHARIAAMITNIDQNVGRLLARLDALGLTENTLVLFLVDNGPNTRRYVGPLRGAKTEIHEGGIRSPLWARWPARIRPGHTRDEVAAHIDVMPTILDACGVALPSAVRLDGRSLLPLLEGEPTDWPDRYIAIQAHRGDRPQRYHHFMIRDRRWKLLHASGFGRQRFRGAPRFELYDLLNDPGEAVNLVDNEPEVFARLKEAYDKWFDDVSSTRPDNYAPPRIRIGTPHEQVTVLTRQDWRGKAWDDATVGHWEVHIAKSSSYDVHVEFTARSEARTAVLRIGDVERTQVVAAEATMCDFEGLVLPQGDCQIRGSLTAAGQTRGVYQIAIRCCQ